MRFSLVVLLLCFSTLAAQDEKRTTDQQLAESLRQMHDRAADLFNEGDPAGGYRLFQGGLMVARDLLGHHPDLQKVIRDGMADADRQPSVPKRAFALHDLTEKVRTELNARGKKSAVPEKSPSPDKKSALIIPPREVTDPKPRAKVDEVVDGVVGRIIWRGRSLANVEVTFVSLGYLFPRVYKTTTGPEGIYRFGEIELGKYVILVVPGPKCEVKTLPERYSSLSTTPLRMDVQRKGEKLDFVLQ
jgi:hypothetical protein